MNKQRRGDAPSAVPAVTYANGIHPLNSAVPQGGFEQGNIRSGNLRDHNGREANRAAVMATTHYDGDYGSTGAATPPPMGMTQAVDTGGGGAPVGPSGGGGGTGAVATELARPSFASGGAPIGADSFSGSGGMRGGSSGGGGLGILKGLRRGRGGINR